MQKAIPYMQIRGGSSKGLYFNAADLPADNLEKDKILLAAMAGVGPEDLRQIDGLGGADPLTSKVGIISLSTREDADLDYEFVQVVLGKGKTDRTQNCGNILAGVVPFAIETGMLNSSDPVTEVRVFMSNSASICTVGVQSPGGLISYTGKTKIDGVPGTSAPINCKYEQITGSTCGSLLPTGNKVDIVDGIEITCLDNGMPVVLLRASDLDRSGYENPQDLNSDVELKQRIESIRLQAGKLMNLGDVSEKVVPKMTLISPPVLGGLVCTRSFIPHRVHAAIGVLAAVTVATGCLIPGSVADGISQKDSARTTGDYSVEHPSGEVFVSLKLDTSGVLPVVREAGIIRTARALCRGEILLPEGI